MDEESAAGKIGRSYLSFCRRRDFRQRIASLLADEVTHGGGRIPSLRARRGGAAPVRPPSPNSVIG